jgi:Acetyltransferase (GNAT) domain
MPAPEISASAGETRLSKLGVALIDPVSGLAWDSLISAHPEASAFHTSAWARVLVNAYGHRPFYLHLSEGGRSLALVPLMEVASPFTGCRGVSLPFSDFCEPLLFPGANMESLLPSMQTLASERRWRYVEFRGAVGSAVVGHSLPTFYGHTLDLRGGAETLFSQLDGSVRRAIRKAEASELTIHVERTPEALDQFVALHARTRKRHGVPAQPPLFFSQIYEQIIRPGLGFVVLARCDATAVAAAIFFVWGAKAIYKFGASDQTNQSLRGNNLAMWNGIRYLAESNVQQLDFGRTALEHEGLRRFKLGWGTTERAITYWRRETKSQTCALVTPRQPGLSAQIFRHMPVKVNGVAGRLLYPHLD